MAWGACVWMTAPCPERSSARWLGSSLVGAGPDRCAPSSRPTSAMPSAVASFACSPVAVTSAMRELRSATDALPSAPSTMPAVPSDA